MPTQALHIPDALWRLDAPVKRAVHDDYNEEFRAALFDFETEPAGEHRPEQAVRLLLSLENLDRVRALGAANQKQKAVEALKASGWLEASKPLFRVLMPLQSRDVFGASPLSMDELKQHLFRRLPNDIGTADIAHEFVRKSDAELRELAQWVIENELYWNLRHFAINDIPDHGLRFVFEREISRLTKTSAQRLGEQDVSLLLRGLRQHASAEEPWDFARGIDILDEIHGLGGQHSSVLLTEADFDEAKKPSLAVLAHRLGLVEANNEWYSGLSSALRQSLGRARLALMVEMDNPLVISRLNKLDPMQEAEYRSMIQCIHVGEPHLSPDRKKDRLARLASFYNHMPPEIGIKLLIENLQTDGHRKAVTLAMRDREPTKPWLTQSAVKAGLSELPNQLKVAVIKFLLGLPGAISAADLVSLAPTPKSRLLVMDKIAGNVMETAI